MDINKHLDKAFEAIFEMQNDDTPMAARDSAWLRAHEGKLADAQDAVLAARAELSTEGASPPEETQ
jgi:hypothetical protein